MNTKDLERSIKQILVTGSGYGPEFIPTLKQTKEVLKKINKGRKTAENFFNLGELCLKLEDSGLALEAFKTGYKLNPNHVNCGCYYGLLLEQEGNIAQALSVYLELNTIAPENIVLAERMLSIFYEKKDYRQVFIICQYFLSNNLNYAVTYEYIAKIYFDYALVDGAIKYLENALAIEPENDKYIRSLILYYYNNKNFNKVVGFENYIVNTKGIPIGIHLSYANSLASIGKTKEARNYFIKVLLNCEGKEKYSVLSEIALFHTHFEQNTKKSIFIFEYILKRDPFNIMALSNMALHRNNDYSLSAYKEAFQQQPNNKVIALNYAYSLLDDGQLKEGFKLYENRIAVNQKFLSQRVHSPENLEDKKLLIWKEQGLGDEIQWSWFYKQLSKSSIDATIQVEERLLPLMIRSFPKLTFTGQTTKELIDEDNFSQYDDEVLMASLGKYYIDDILEAQYNIETGSFEDHYLLADNIRISYWKDKLQGLTSKKTVGVCWRTGLVEKMRYLHCLSVEQIVEIFSDIDCCVVNVQYNYTKDELELLSSVLGDRFIHFPEIDLKNDQDDLAALLKALDLVFTASTAVHDLSAAIGVDTLCYTYIGANEYQSIYGKPFHFAYPTLKFLGQKNLSLEDSMEYFKINLSEALK